MLSMFTDVCTPKPCGRHGTCTVQSDTPVCDCTDGYTGDRCEKGLWRPTLITGVFNGVFVTEVRRSHL